MIDFGGLKCDNPACDWEDTFIEDEDFPKYLNSRCVKCNEMTILTPHDYQLVLIAKKFLNNNIFKGIFDGK